MEKLTSILLLTRKNLDISLKLFNFAIITVPLLFISNQCNRLMIIEKVLSQADSLRVQTLVNNDSNEEQEQQTNSVRIYSHHPAPKLSPDVGAGLGNRYAKTCRLAIQS